MSETPVVDHSAKQKQEKKEKRKLMLDAALFDPCCRKFIMHLNRSRDRVARKATAAEKKQLKVESKAVAAIEEAALTLWPIAIAQGLSDSSMLRIRQLIEYTPVFDCDTRLEDPTEKELDPM